MSVEYRDIYVRKKMCKNWISNQTCLKTQLGTRQIVRMEEEKNPKTGKVFTKLVLGDYQWISLKQVNANSRNFGLGLRALDIPARYLHSLDEQTTQRKCHKQSDTVFSSVVNVLGDTLYYVLLSGLPFKSDHWGS